MYVYTLQLCMSIYLYILKAQHLMDFCCFRNRCGRTAQDRFIVH